MTDLSQAIASKLNLKAERVEATLALLDDGATIPFISRYRKERTGNLNEIEIHDIATLAEQLRELEKRKAYVSEVITTAGAMTPELAKEISEADAVKLEDIYLPFKPKRRTRATIARERGLEPLAKIIMAGNARDVRSIASRYLGDEV